MSTGLYRPWNPVLVEAVLRDYREGAWPVLYLETSAICNACSCVYCDSRVGEAEAGELTAQEALDVLRQFSSLGGRLLFICGLGEPLQDPKLFEILAEARKLDIMVSLFTNGVFLSERNVSLLREYDANLLLKIDSLESETFDRMIGRDGTADRILTNVRRLLETGYQRSSPPAETNLGVSCVATKLNARRIPDLVAFCVRHKLFPVIGELESAGKAKERYHELALDRVELLDLRRRVESVLKHPYQRPLCPSVIVGAHINNRGDCVIDAGSGFPCAWFLLEEPDYISIGNVREASLESLFRRVCRTRLDKLPDIQPKLATHTPVFGGGGVAASDWYELYGELTRTKAEKEGIHVR